jgi:hypothetical protein
MNRVLHFAFFAKWVGNQEFHLRTALPGNFPPLQKITFLWRTIKVGVEERSVLPAQRIAIPAA